MQLVDELSMIYTTCLMMHASFSYSRSQVFSVVLGVGLLSLAGSITVSTSPDGILIYTRLRHKRH
jgi:dihydroceramidase